MLSLPPEAGQVVLSIVFEEAGTATKYEAGNKFDWVLMFSFGINHIHFQGYKCLMDLSWMQNQFLLSVFLRRLPN